MSMKQLNVLLPLLTAALVGTTLTANSQQTNATPGSTSLSLEALVAEALKKNPELKFFEAELAAAKAGRKTAGSFANPEVSLTSSNFGQVTGTAGSNARVLQFAATMSF